MSIECEMSIKVDENEEIVSDQTCWHWQMGKQYETNITPANFIEVRMISYIRGFVHDCGISRADALEIPQSCTKPIDIIKCAETSARYFSIETLWRWQPLYNPQDLYTKSDGWPWVCKWQPSISRTHFTDKFSSTIESTFCNNFIPDHLITNFYTCHDCTTFIILQQSLHHNLDFSKLILYSISILCTKWWYKQAPKFCQDYTTGMLTIFLNDNSNLILSLLAIAIK